MEDLPIHKNEARRDYLTFVLIAGVILCLFAFGFILWQMEGVNIFTGSYLSQFATCF